MRMVWISYYQHWFSFIHSGLLRENGVDFQLPTLVFSECALTYVEYEDSKKLCAFLQVGTIQACHMSGFVVSKDLKGLFSWNCPERNVNKKLNHTMIYKNINNERLTS